MKATRLKLIRLTQDKNRIQKLGMLFAFDRFNLLFRCYILEPFDSIPAGSYTLSRYQSPKFNRVVLLYDNLRNEKGELRYIEIHPGNYRSDTRGCQLPGDGVVDMNADGLRDVTNSNATMNKLLGFLPDGQIKIDVFENPVDFNA